MKMILPLMIIAAITTGCTTLPDSNQFANASAACFQGPGWNGGQVSILYVGIDKGVSGTKGGAAGIKCGSSEVNFTDSGNLMAVTAPRVQVSVEPVQLKLVPK